MSQRREKALDLSVDVKNLYKVTNFRRNIEASITKEALICIKTIFKPIKTNKNLIKTQKNQKITGFFTVFSSFSEKTWFFGLFRKKQVFSQH